MPGARLNGAEKFWPATVAGIPSRVMVVSCSLTLPVTVMLDWVWLVPLAGAMAEKPGAMVSTMNDAKIVLETLPALSVAVAVKLFAPSVKRTADVNVARPVTGSYTKRLPIAVPLRIALSW